MPAHRTYRPHQHEESLEIRAIGDMETTWYKKSKSVYFTDQSPRFTIIAENTGAKKIDLNCHVRLQFEDSDREYERWEKQRISVELEPGEVEEIEWKVDMLSHQGSAAIVLDVPRVRDKDGKLKTRTGPRRLFRIYTFMVYDREFYKVNYLTPRRAQILSAVLAVLIVATGVANLAFNFM